VNAAHPDRDLYYQTIAKEFFRLRGAPFHLSPKDVELVAHWEKLRVPLDAVLEGMGLAFENFRKGQRPAKALTLAFCEYQVMKSFGQHAERRAGSARKKAPRDDKKTRLLQEIERFLKESPTGPEEIRGIFQKAYEILDKEQVDEEALERLDDNVDEILWNNASAGEKERIRADALAEFGGARGMDLRGAVRTRVIKAARGARRIPALALFYY
jgi:hypothetical protein